MCHDFSTISTPKKPSDRNFLPAQNISAMRNHEKTPQVPFYNHSRNMRSPASQQGPWMNPRGTTPVLHGIQSHPNNALHHTTPNIHYSNNRRLTPTMSNKNNFSPYLANNAYRRRTHSETLPTRTPSRNTPNYNARVSLLASPTQLAKHASNNVLPKVKTVAVPLTCEEVEAQASKGKFKGPLTCDEVELLQASSVVASAQQLERASVSSPTPSSSSGYESISGLLSVFTGEDDQSDISSSPSSPMSDSVFCSFDKNPVMQSSPIRKAAPSSPWLVASPCTPSIKESILDSTLSTIYNPEDDGYSSSDSVDKFFSAAQIGSDKSLCATLALKDTKPSKSMNGSPSPTDNWQTSVQAVGLPCKFLSSEDTMKNNTNIKPNVKTMTTTTTTTNSNKNKKGKTNVTTTSPAPKAACVVMPTICSSPPQAAHLPLPPNMWVKPTTEPSSAETKRVDVTGFFTTLLSRANSPVASNTEPIVISSNGIGSSTLESKCSGDGSLGALFSSLDIQTGDNVMSPDLYHRERNLYTNECALGVLKQNLHGIHRNFNMMSNAINLGTVAA